VVGPDASKPGTLTEPRPVQPDVQDLRGRGPGRELGGLPAPGTAQGIFLNFKNVVDTMRSAALRHRPDRKGRSGTRVTPRNFIFRSREFEQMEIEWFCHPEEARTWYEFWCEQRKNWWRSIGLHGENINMRSHQADELAHYAREGCGTFDIEYRFPFSAPGFDELEGWPTAPTSICASTSSTPGPGSNTSIRSATNAIYPT